MQQFYLSGLQTFLIQEDSVFNFTDLVAYHTHGKEGDSIPADTSTGEPFKFYLYDIEFKNARIEYENKVVGDTLFLRNLSFTIPYVGWDQEEKSEAGLRFNLEKEGYLEAGVNINPIAGEFDATLTLHGFYLESLSRYASTYANIGTLQGVFSTRLEVIGYMDEPENSVVSGEMELRDLYVTDTREQEFLGAGTIRAGIREIDLYHSRFMLDSVSMIEPYIFFELKDSSNNFFDILGYIPEDTLSAETAGPEAGSLADSSSSSLYYAVQSFRMEKGIIDLRDHTTGEPFDYHLSDIAIQSDSIESSSEKLTIYASMLLNNRGSLVAETAFDPLSPANFTLDYTIKDFRLSDLNIYSRHYVGFPVIFGEMFYRGHTRVVDKQLVSDNHLVIDNVELGEKRGGLLDLPLKFALYILKDRNNVIDLEIPVRGRTDDPKVSVGQIVWNTIKNLIIRTATAPYDYLSDLLGVDPGDIESIQFTYGDTTLSEGILKQLDLLLELEALKSSMEIELIYFNDREREKRAIMMAETGTDSTTFATPEPTTQEELAADSLATLFSALRIFKIEQYLRTSSDSTQITLLMSDPQDPMNTGTPPRFEVHYSLKDDQLLE
jgi:hypothetical protein